MVCNLYNSKQDDSRNFITFLSLLIPLYRIDTDTTMCLRTDLHGELLLVHVEGEFFDKCD